MSPNSCSTVKIKDPIKQSRYVKLRRRRSSTDSDIVGGFSAYFVYAVYFKDREIITQSEQFQRKSTIFLFWYLRLKEKKSISYDKTKIICQRRARFIKLKRQTLDTKSDIIDFSNV